MVSKTRLCYIDSVSVFLWFIECWVKKQAELTEIGITGYTSMVILQSFQAVSKRGAVPWMKIV